mmetsp:Transcript_15540/g.44185  ORF Transcript_15540/g.44185 Transcript_15540/m.44185 type:complete len:189 (+) Transcript_15540:193-759(+)
MSQTMSQPMAQKASLSNLSEQENPIFVGKHPSDRDSDVDNMEVAPLLHSEMQKVHGRTKCQTCAIVTQTVLLTCIGLVIIAGILVINYRFGSLNSELNSIAETGVLARPLLSSATNLTDNFNDLTGSLGGALGLTGNESLASGVKDLTSQLADAGKDLLSGLTDTASSARDSRQDNKSNDDENKASDP